MYEYHWDEETGGLLLTTNQAKFSKEPRPVYYHELDILGFGEFWNYPKDDSAPLMWAEANNYIYKGRHVAKTKGGSLYTKPEIVILDEPEPNGGMLEFVDIQAMCEKNRSILETLVQETIQKIYNTYMEYRKKIDIYYVAFSGGKDSVVALDLVQRALPHDAFLVLFGDTQMEFSDTYDLVEKQKEICAKEDIKFIVAKSEQDPEFTWHEFGTPSQTMRWCCSVHKTAPQILKLRELTGDPSFRGMAFTGVRGDESVSRSQYDDVTYGGKHKGQYSCHAILEWSSAEVFLYIYENNLLLNETYKKGNSRAGCLVCPMALGKSMFIRDRSYNDSCGFENSTTKFFNMILETVFNKTTSERKKREYLDNCKWRSRKSGRDLNFSKEYCVESRIDGILTITLSRERTEWQEWMKTVGDIVSISDRAIELVYEKKNYVIERQVKRKQQVFSVDLSENTQNDIYFGSALKTVFRKTAYCIGCHVCEANCPNGYISMKDGRVNIDDSCIKCRECHKVAGGCLVSNSLHLTKGNETMKSINRYDDMGCQYTWVVEYFDKKDNFWNDNNLGKNKIKNLRNFLIDADIILSKKYTITSFGEKIADIGIETETAWGLIVSNLVYTEQFGWWVLHTDLEQVYTPIQIDDLLSDHESNADIRKRIIYSIKNIYSSNRILGKTLGLGDATITSKGRSTTLIDITRTKWEEPIPEVILYSLFKFAEACDGYYQFSLSTLLDDTLERNGISPTRIFGLDRETMVGILNNLSTHYPEFIRASFTLDLETITLSEDKTAEDVLTLF